MPNFFDVILSSTKDIYLIVSLVLLSCLNFSCQNSELIVVEQFDNGEVKRSIEVVSPKKQIKREFKINGALIDSFVEIDGKIEGVRKLILEDNCVVIENYALGQLNGNYRQYYPSGELKITGDFSEGKMIGLHKMLFKNGRIKQEVQCVDGFEHGEDKFYYSSGALKRQGLMVWGKQEGSWYRYYPNGKLKIYEYFIKGKRRFIRQYNESGDYKDNGDLIADVKLNFDCAKGIKVEDGWNLPDVIELKSDSVWYRLKPVNPPNTKNYLLLCEDLEGSEKICDQGGNSVSYKLNELDSTSREVLYVFKLKGKVDYSMRLISVDTLMKRNTSFLYTQAYLIND